MTSSWVCWLLLHIPQTHSAFANLMHMCIKQYSEPKVLFADIESAQSAMKLIVNEKGLSRPVLTSSPTSVVLARVGFSFLASSRAVSEPAYPTPSQALALSEPGAACCGCKNP